MQASLPLCSTCHMRPVWVDPSNNRLSPYCSKKCRGGSQASFQISQPQNFQQRLPSQYSPQPQPLPQQPQGTFSSTHLPVLPTQGVYNPPAPYFQARQTPTQYTSISSQSAISAPYPPYYNGCQTTGQICAQCLRNPAIFVYNKASPFCSRRCADAHKHIVSPSNAPYSPPNPQQLVQTSYRAPQGSVQTPYGIPQGPVYTNIGHMTTHTNSPLQAFPPVIRSNEKCLECGINGKWIENGRVLDWCGNKCKISANAKAPTMYLLDPTSATYKNVAYQFTAAWPNGSGQHNIHLIWKIHSSPAIRQAYETYRQSVESNRKCDGRPLASGRKMTAGNEQRRWHGTSLACEIGYAKGNNKICKSSTCAVCRIIETSYRLSHAKAGGAMGQGVYFSSAASKSHGYNSQSSKAIGGKTLRCMFLNKVIVGNTKKYTTHTRASKSTLGTQFDSVCLDSNFNDEVVVFEENACLPTYLIVYES